MSCPYRAIYLVTREMQGTSSNVAKERVELSCDQPEGHEGPHRNTRRGLTWDDNGKSVTTIVRHEDEIG